VRQTKQLQQIRIVGSWPPPTCCVFEQYQRRWDEMFTEAKIDALNSKLIERGISADQVIAILPVEAQIVANPTPPQFPGALPCNIDISNFLSGISKSPSI